MIEKYKGFLTTQKQLSLWLGAGVIMIFIQILLGGITRLTGSGLSITEWKPLMGALPPLSQAEWQQSFAHYREIAQFKKLNNHFTLADYQGLFFWEWLHREWARLMGLVFLVPFLIFLVQRKFKNGMFWPLAGLFVLGAVQGLAGWLMVKSGLNETDVVVSHIRLAIHFDLALILLVYLYCIFLSQRFQKRLEYIGPKLRRLTILILLLLALQLTYGAFMAGTHAALFAPTWPDINGKWLMMTPTTRGNWLHRITFDPLLIQFAHRLLAYLLSGLLFTWFLMTSFSPNYTPVRRLRGYPLAFVLMQVILGVLALRVCGTSYYIWIAVLHQLNGIMLLLSLVHFFFRSSSRAI